MKKILLPILTLASLLFVSCQMEEPGSGKLTGEVDFSITAEIPNGIMTYTPAGTGSHNGGAVLLDPEEYTLRYTLEVYEKDGTLAYEATENAENGTFNGVTFDVRLLAKTYDLVFWADFVKKEGNVEFYNVADLKNITYQNGITVQDLTTDAADAYYGTKEVNLAESNQTLQVTLRRPFGKIRLLATDNPQNQVADELKVPASAIIEFTDTKVPAVFNALSGEASGEMEITGYTFEARYDETEVSDAPCNAYLLGQTYFFESPSSTSYKMKVTVNNEGGQIGYRELSGIPVNENKLTTVIGNFYTNEGSIDVIVEDGFTNGEETWNEEGAKYVGTVEEVIAALENGKSIILLNDIQIPENTSISISSGIVSSIDLNGHKLYTTNSEGVQFQEMFEVVGTLNISNGTVQFEYTSENMGWNGGTAVFNVHGGGILNMEDVVVNDLGGTDMSFCVHLNNWGDVTLNADNCEFNTPYCGVRVFNSGPDMNNVNITNSKLTGASRAFWVHNYIGDISNATEEEIKNRLNIDLYNNNNSFVLTGTAKSPIRYGFQSPVFFDEKGERVMDVWGGDSENPVIDDEAQTVTVNSSAQLAGLAKMVNGNTKDFSGYTITLNADIDLAGLPWTPIGNGNRGDADASHFSGVFDGNGHTIRNINAKDERGDNYGAGLFSIVKDATVKNLNVEGGSVEAVDFAAAVVGIAFGNTTIENCHVKGVSVKTDDVAAGIVARAYGTDVTVKGCTNASDIYAAKKAGGIAGIASNNCRTVIENCTNSGSVKAPSDGVGGILGYAGPAENRIVNCRNTASVGASDNKYAGGIVGYQASTDPDKGLVFENCINEGTVTGTNAGGIYGIPGSSQPVTITGSVNNGAVNGTTSAGGIAARAGSGKIENCTNTANVTAAADNKGVAGGIAGNLGEARIISCKGGDASAVISAQYAGRLVGHVSNKPYKPEDVLAELQIDDSNGDCYEGYLTIGTMGLYTSWANINITSGTLHGKPLIEGEASGYIKIHEGASWDAYPGQTGTWKCAPTDNNVWTKL